MNVLGIVGSRRKNGNTAYLVQQVQRAGEKLEKTIRLREETKKKLKMCF
ncbi:hypothetical protein [Clostridium sp.]